MAKGKHTQGVPAGGGRREFLRLEPGRTLPADEGLPEGAAGQRARRGPPGAGGRAQLDAEGYGGGTGDRGLRGGRHCRRHRTGPCGLRRDSAVYQRHPGHGPGPAGE